MKIINKSLLNTVTSEAQLSPRLRKTYNFHTSQSDPIQRFINAFEPGTYVTPHLHKNSREVFIILSGKIAFVIFDENGSIIDRIILDKNSDNYGLEIQPNTWHTVIPLDTNTVCYEIKDGPYNIDTDKTFASWAPMENTKGTNEFLHELIKSLKI